MVKAEPKTINFFRAQLKQIFHNALLLPFRTILEFFIFIVALVLKNVFIRKKRKLYILLPFLIHLYLCYVKQFVRKLNWNVIFSFSIQSMSRPIYLFLSPSHLCTLNVSSIKRNIHCSHCSDWLKLIYFLFRIFILKEFNSQLYIQIVPIQYPMYSSPFQRNRTLNWLLHNY